MSNNIKLSSLLTEGLPFLILLFYVVVVIIIRVNLPPAEQIIATVSGFYRDFGYPFILFSGLLESLFLIGFYFPGSAAILLGAALARTGVVFLPFIILFGTLGLMAGYTINYLLGKYGWYKVLAKFGLEKSMTIASEKLEQHGTKALFISYLSPNSASVISTAAGVVNYPFAKFFITSLVSQLFWSIAWGTIAYLLGDIFIELFVKYAQFIILGIIAVILIRQWVKKKREK